jgi:glycosyltransferase involved in cell wall biosynthesis
MPVDVSVVIAAKNEAIHVSEAVRSVLCQTGVSFELIFVDDGSTDNTHDQVLRAAAGHDNVTILRNPDAGKVRAFNLGVAHARGDWCCLFAGDDIMTEGGLSARWRAVAEVASDKPVVGLCRILTLSEDKSKDGQIIPRRSDRGAYSGLSYMMDRRALDLMFPVPAELPNEDTWLEMCATMFDLTVVHSPVIGTKWRIHAGNSINLEVPFDDFDRKLTPRMAAPALFLAKHGDDIPAEARHKLERRVKCEEARKARDMMGILLSGASPVERLRALSLSNATLYGVRQRFYGLLSGW